MNPIDFVLYDGDSVPNTPVFRVTEAMQKPLRIVSVDGYWIVRGYYYDDEAQEMVLEIEADAP